MHLNTRVGLLQKLLLLNQVTRLFKMKSKNMLKISSSFLRKGLFLFLWIVVFNGCSGKKIDDNNPEDLFKDAQSDVENDRYQLALDKFRTLKNKHPYSNFSKLAQLRMADVNFLMESYDEAAANYETFVELYPKHEQVPYSLYRVGESYQAAMPSTIARDLSSGAKAIEAYEKYLRIYPGDARANDARNQLMKVKNDLAEKELYIGNYYRRHDQYESAQHRYLRIIKYYPDTKAASDAKDKLPQVQEKLVGKKPEIIERNGAPRFRGNPENDI